MQRRTRVARFTAAVGLLMASIAVTTQGSIAGAVAVDPSVGMLRVTTNPAVPSQITVDGNVADSWGLTWLQIAPGPHQVCFSDIEGFTTPPCQTVAVTTGNTTTVEGNFTQLGYLQVTTNPPVASQISVDGIPRNNWGLYTTFPAGPHQVCFGAVAGYATPACQTVTVTAGSTTPVAGTFALSNGATGLSNVGMLRVTTNPAVPSKITVDGNVADAWGLTWLQIAPGSHQVCFSDIEGFTTPPCQTVAVTTGNTTTVEGNFTQLGYLQVTTNPPVASQISVDGIPRNNWGIYTGFPTGSHEICFGETPGFDPPPCQTVSVAAGQTTPVDSLVCPSPPGTSSISETECAALVDLFIATDGLDWTYRPGWLTAADPCTWFGVTCDAGSVTEIDLTENKLIGSVPPSIGDLTNLTRLSLADNSLDSIPPEIGNLTNLTHLDLGDHNPVPGGNALTSIPPAIGNLTGLVYLSLSGNHLTTLPGTIGNLTNLTTLQLSSNELTSLPTQIGNLASVSTMWVDRNQLTTLPTTIGNLTNLWDLQIGWNQLASLPSQIGTLTNLDTLSVEYNQLTALPAQIGNLTSLTTLNLAENNVASLPPSIGNLANLGRLNLIGNELTSLPSQFGNLSSLWKLVLGYNHLASLPPEFGNLTGLAWLELAENDLATLPAQFANLTNLGYLDLSGNQLTSLPASIGNLSYLQTLHLSGNQLTTLPASIGNLTALYHLDLADNLLTTLPTQIGNLAGLGYLDLSDNQLTSLPAQVGNLINLGTLNLVRNRLTGDITNWTKPIHDSGVAALWFLALADTEPGGNSCLSVTDPAVETWLPVVAGPDWSECAP